MLKDFFGTCLSHKEYQRAVDVIFKNIDQDPGLKAYIHADLVVLESKARVNENMLIYNEIDAKEFNLRSEELQIEIENLIEKLPPLVVNQINFAYDAVYDEVIHSAYSTHFSSIKFDSPIQYVYQQAGKVCEIIAAENRAREIYVPEAIDHAAIYYMSIHLKKFTSNYFIIKLNVMELAEGITRQIMDYLESDPEIDNTDYFKQ